MDCHNRPSHNYQTPIIFVNNAITAREIPKELPDIKMLAMQVLSKEYSTKDSAMMGIEAELREYYPSSYADIYESDPELIDKAIKGIQDGYSKNIFPEMKVRWNAYPNHIGHLEFNGCFRCHNNRHTAEDGSVISQDCNLCHTIIAQGSPDSMQVVSGLGESLDFFHPNDPDAMWKEGVCSDCHRDLY
jgi:hypothetical protein